MPPSKPNASGSLFLVSGDDDFAVKERAKQIFQQWTSELGGTDHEQIDGGVTSATEALRVLKRVNESLQTLPFFGTAKVVWLRNCSFLGDERAASAASVTEQVTALAQSLKDFRWDNVRLLISAGKVDKRKVFYKTLDKVGTVETYSGWSLEDRDWANQAEAWARKTLATKGKRIAEDALAELVGRVGPNRRQLDNEVEKLSLYVGDRADITMEDVSTISVRNKSARAFALGDALGDRDLPRLMKRLDEELWEVRLDAQKSPIGLLYGLISKVRGMILLKEMLREGWIKPAADYPRFKAQLERVPADQMPKDKRFDPLSMSPYVLYKAQAQAANYTPAELVRAMDVLLQCNQRLVSSSLDDTLVLQQALVQILEGRQPGSAPAARR
jgi:DNA polymerase-3 subunit delta